MKGKKIKRPSRGETISANIDIHTALAKTGDYRKSPHFYKKNVTRVRALLRNLVQECPSRQCAIDFGCGTGFIIDLICDLFDQIHGVDITDEMLIQVDRSPGNIYLHKCEAETTPFEDESFDFATAYSFMDHLYDYSDFLREVFRLLRTGGVFYSDLNPNREFIESISRADKMNLEQYMLSESIQREVEGAIRNGMLYSERFGINAELLDTAEPIKSVDKGFSMKEVIEKAYEIGFTRCRVDHHWFIDQAKYENSEEYYGLDCIEKYLLSTQPLSSPLFKYLRFVFIK